MNNRTAPPPTNPDALQNLMARYWGRVAQTDDPKEHQRAAAQVLEELRRVKVK